MDSYRSWIGRKVVAREELAPTLVRRLAATLGVDLAELRRGDFLPSGWHVVLFATETASGALDVDGHPPRGDFLPPVSLPRRMMAGRRLTFMRPLTIGNEVVRTSEIADIASKTGRTGELVFVTVRHTLADAHGPAVIEEQDIVYRESAPRAAQEGRVADGARVDLVQSPAEPSTWQEHRVFDTVTLFRYSAVTFNAHRIHFDLEFARNVEGYEDLVVNSGLITLPLLALAQAWSGQSLAAAVVRSTAVAFAGRPVAIHGAVQDVGMHLWATQDGRRCVETRVDFADAATLAHNDSV
jgi:3-methylfumaryl-CoA hydratase